jgi:hypothetical protein
MSRAGRWRLSSRASVAVLAGAAGGIAAAALAGGGVALAAPAMRAGSAMSGNPRGIKLAHEVMRAFAHIRVYAQTEEHYFQIKSNRRAGTFYYRFGVPHRPGYYWAREHATVAVDRNHVVWWTDQLTPVGRHQSPMVVVIDKSGRYSAFGTLSHHSCFARIGRGNSLPYRYGGLGYSIGGRMGAPRSGPTTEVLPYLYAWQMHQTAHERDTIKRATKLVLSGTVNVTRSDGKRALAFQFANTYPRRRPPAPKVRVCT